MRVASALQDLEPQQLLLFVQSFGIPVSSMSKLLQHLDQAVGHDPQALEQSIMDKSESQARVCGQGRARGGPELRAGGPKPQWSGDAQPAPSVPAHMPRP